MCRDGIAVSDSDSHSDAVTHPDTNAPFTKPNRRADTGSHAKTNAGTNAFTFKLRKRPLRSEPQPINETRLPLIYLSFMMIVSP
jgi:hypothetical protein